MRILNYFLLAFLVLLSSCDVENQNKSIDNNPYVVVLGTTQDAGSPQLGCKKECCANLLNRRNPSRKVVSLGLVDPSTNNSYMFEASPDFVDQFHLLQKHANTNMEIDGIFLTHAHIGHYTGLMYLGRESMNASKISVYAMPKMCDFLRNNGPWSQLVSQENITLQGMSNVDTILLSPSLKVVPIQVPHRDEFSETVGYKIIGPNASLLFIPDIDKWEKWETDILGEIKQVDYAFLDATFYDSKELPGRNMDEIPHPFVVESMELFKDLSAGEKKKVYFIHFNHTNPLLDKESEEYKRVNTSYNTAVFGDVIGL